MKKTDVFHASKMCEDVAIQISSKGNRWQKPEKSILKRVTTNRELQVCERLKGAGCEAKRPSRL